MLWRHEEPAACKNFSPAVSTVSLSLVHTGDKVEVNTVDFLCRLCCFDPVHTVDKVDCSGNKVHRVGESVDRDKLSNLSC